jgi:hypothetical protein
VWEVAGLAQRGPADVVGLGGDAEHAQQILGDLVGGLGVIAFRVAWIS